MRVSGAVFTFVALAAAASACGTSGSDQPAPTGTIAVAEAVGADYSGETTVAGLLLLSEGDSAVLCDHPLDSRPPECGDEGLPVVGVDVSAMEGAATVRGVSWVDRVTLTGRLENGTFVVGD